MRGRPCCARCFTPWGCTALIDCGCHRPSTETCGFCGVALFVPPPQELTFRMLFSIESRVAA